MSSHRAVLAIAIALVCAVPVTTIDRRQSAQSQSGTATTATQGIFRIESLTPGDYAVCASTNETAPLNDAQRLQMEIDRQRRLAAFVLGPPGIEAQKALAPHLAALEARLPPSVPPV